MNPTISLKIPQELAIKLKKASKLRGISMSDLIRQNLQNTFSSDAKNSQEPKVFEYFGVIANDIELENFDKELELRRAGYKNRKINL